MDVIDTSLSRASGSLEKLNPKHGFDEEQVSSLIIIILTTFTFQENNYLPILTF
jgi:hypothetical protein